MEALVVDRILHLPVYSLFHLLDLHFLCEVQVVLYFCKITPRVCRWTCTVKITCL
jgi:hypothetical protein